MVVVDDLGDLDRRLSDRVDVVFDACLFVQLRHGMVHRFLEHDTTTEPLIDDCRRHLALAETGDVHLLGNPGVGMLERVVEILERDVRGELDLRR